MAKLSVLSQTSQQRQQNENKRWLLNNDSDIHHTINNRGIMEYSHKLVELYIYYPETSVDIANKFKTRNLVGSTKSTLRGIQKQGFYKGYKFIGQKMIKN